MKSRHSDRSEIHLKEKHSNEIDFEEKSSSNNCETTNSIDLTCSFCLSSNDHPRLSRGEHYPCGFKPYRCHPCLYSTTTKGNLAIHMQSDKHLNNCKDFLNLSSIDKGLFFKVNKFHRSNRSTWREKRRDETRRDDRDIYSFR